MFETLTRALFAAPLSIVATPPCDLCSAQTLENQQKGYHRLCSRLPGAGLTTPFTNSVRKRRSFSDVNSWRSYEQCLFSAVSCAPFMLTWAFVWTFACPSVWPQPPSPFLVKRLCVWWVQLPLPFLTSVCLYDFEIHKHCSQPSMQLRFECLGRLALELTISSKESEHLGGTWSCKRLPRLSGNHPENCQSASYLHH